MTKDSGASRAPACTRGDLAALLPEWDQLEIRKRSEVVAHARVCARCGEDLDLLQRAQAWLDPEGALPQGCPSSEELYAMGRGPGAPPLAPERREILERHLSACADCAGFSATLASRPPSPLELEPLAAPRSTELPATLSPRPMGSTMRRLIPFAAAAAAVIALFFISRGGSDAADRPDVRYPAIPQLRGERAGPLLFPRSKVLAGASGLQHGLVFEVLAPEGTSLVRVKLEKHAGGAFDQGTAVATFSSPTPLFPAGAEAANLAPGRYTWEAWAVVDGLDQLLGRRDFEVVRDLQTSERLERLAGEREPGRSEGILALLHERGFLSDARTFARTLPASPERAVYLEAQAAR